MFQKSFSPLFKLSIIGILCCLSVDAGRRHVTATGRVLCSISGTSHPVEYAIVRLKDKDLLFHDTFGSTRSNSRGYFTVSGSAYDLFSNPDPFIEVEFEYNGVYGRMDVENELFGINRQESTSTRSHSSRISFGDIVFSGDHCRAYVMYYQAMKDYRQRTSKTLPYSRLKVITKAPFHGGTPYATTDSIRIPSGHNYGHETAKHELAHTVRHSLDGDVFHFLYDVIKFTYTQTHTCGKRTNEGFAFNEGWAEYWAGTCTTGIYGSNSSDYSYEGNVAKALTALKNHCNTTDGQMINVLQNNKGSIHSFSQFAAAHRRLYAC